MPKPNSLARGTPPPHVQNRSGLARLFDRILDGHVWELRPEDLDGQKPRRAFGNIREYAASKHLNVLVAKRGHLLYVQNRDAADGDNIVHTVDGHEPERKRWIAVGGEADDDGTDPELEPETPPELPPAITPKPAKSRAKDPKAPPLRVSNKYVSARELEPFVLTCMNEYFTDSLGVSQVLRIVDSLVAQTEETRLVDHNQVRLCLMALTDDPDTLLFRRLATREEIVNMSTYGGRAYLYSPTSPVPAWNAGLGEIINEKYPPPRTVQPQPQPQPQPAGGAAAFVRPTPAPRQLPIPEAEAEQVKLERVLPPERTVIEQPKYRVVAREREEVPTKVEINGASNLLGERSQKVLIELASLLVEAEHGPELAALRSELQAAQTDVTRLLQELKDLRAERDAAVKDRDSAVAQLRAIAQAQRTIAQLLNGGAE